MSKNSFINKTVALTLLFFIVFSLVSLGFDVNFLNKFNVINFQNKTYASTDGVFGNAENNFSNSANYERITDNRIFGFQNSNLVNCGNLQYLTSINKKENGLIRSDALNIGDNFCNKEENGEILTITNPSEVYLGGIPLGIKIGASGLLVTGFNTVSTANGKVNPFKNSIINAGDVLESVNDVSVRSVKELSGVLKDCGGTVELTFNKGGQKILLKTEVLVDVESGEKVLGLKVKEDVLGIGTLTFVDCKKKFGALGHHVVDSDTGVSKLLNCGEIVGGVIIGNTKAKPKTAGHLNGLLSEKTLGKIDKNTNFGIFGEANIDLIKGLTKIEVAGRGEVKMGKAQILSTVHGTKPQLYDVEIVKLTRQNSPSERSMIIRVTDKELIAKTGGIVQGMSGSPIIQNGKLVGALTHVFLSDSKKGYGIYIDWMLNN